jgi:hypothetical protein
MALWRSHAYFYKTKNAVSRFFALLSFSVCLRLNTSFSTLIRRVKCHYVGYKTHPDNGQWNLVIIYSPVTKRLLFLSFDRRTFCSQSTHFESTCSNLNLFVLRIVSQKVNQFWSFFIVSTDNVSIFLSNIDGRSIPKGNLWASFSHKTCTKALVIDKRVFHSEKATFFLNSKRLILFYVYRKQSCRSC